MTKAIWVALVSLTAACAATSANRPAESRSVAHPTTGGGTFVFQDAMQAAPFTVLTFFAANCPIQRAHDSRLKERYAELSSKGVAFFAIDAEADSSLAADEKEAAARGYPYRIVSDPSGSLADALGAQFATETLIVDHQGTVRYRGGIDSDAVTLHDDTTPWLRDAAFALVGGGNPKEAETKAKGCSLRRQ